MIDKLPEPVWKSEILIRRLVQKDLPELEWDGEFKHFRRLYAEIYRSTSQGRALMWVAELPGVGIIGQVFVQLNSTRSELADGLTRAYIYGFKVKPEYREAGIGSNLLRTVEEDLYRRKFDFITLNVGRDNLAARRFYERHGYEVVADEPGRWSYYDAEGQRREINEPAWRMLKAIHPT
jgi:ribosomal protein S18 acetylase RimI-like enzyme